MSTSIDVRPLQPTHAPGQASADNDSPDGLTPVYGVSFSVVLALFGWLLLVLYLRAA